MSKRNLLVPLMETRFDKQPPTWIELVNKLEGFTTSMIKCRREKFKQQFFEYKETKLEQIVELLIEMNGWPKVT